MWKSVVKLYLLEKKKSQKGIDLHQLCQIFFTVFVSSHKIPQSPMCARQQILWLNTLNSLLLNSNVLHQPPCLGVQQLEPSPPLWSTSQDMTRDWLWLKGKAKYIFSTSTPQSVQECTARGSSWTGSCPWCEIPGRWWTASQPAKHREVTEEEWRDTPVNCCLLGCILQADDENQEELTRELQTETVMEGKLDNKWMLG